VTLCCHTVVAPTRPSGAPDQRHNGSVSMVKARASRTVRSLAPGLVALGGYRRRWLRGDLLAGITVAAYLVPQVLAYATIAGLPPVAGLWAIVPALAVYAVLGSSRVLSIGPESTTALMTAAAVGPLAGGDPARYAQLAAALAVVVGLLCLACWAMRLGFVADLLSKPILVGYLAGVALLMIVGQLGKLTGVAVHGDSLLAQLRSFVGQLTQVHVPTLTFAAAVLVFLFVVQWRLPALPGPLLAVLLATAAVAVFGLENHGIGGSVRAARAGAAADRGPAGPAVAGIRGAGGRLHRHHTHRAPSPPGSTRRSTGTRSCWPSGSPTSAPDCCAACRSAAAEAAPRWPTPPAREPRCTRSWDCCRWWRPCSCSGRCWPGSQPPPWERS
jgi:hypothetical protein